MSSMTMVKCGEISIQYDPEWLVLVGRRLLQHHRRAARRGEHTEHERREDAARERCEWEAVISQPIKSMFSNTGLSRVVLNII